MFIRGSVISLTEKEESIFTIIANTIQFKNRKTVARVAGGWVRDKLLKRDSDDIDVALDDQSGVEFANSINDYLKSTGLKSKTVAVIQANPEQSKHLETATMLVLDMDIDFVNLRAERYTEDSRIPEIRFGTPYEDAMRRDFTINSLFFNLLSRECEDFSGRGIDDLERGIIRTPLPPSSTFSDDPLRLLRAIRFASRFNFRLADDLVVTARDLAIHEAIVLKVSRDRVFIELSKMMGGSGHPYVALNIMHRLNVLHTVLLLTDQTRSRLFFSPLVRGAWLSRIYGACVSEAQALSLWEEVSMETTRFLTCLLVLQKRGMFLPLAPSEHRTWRVIMTESVCIDRGALSEVVGGGWVSVLYYAALCMGLNVFSHRDKKNKSTSLVSVLLKESLKMDNDTMKKVQTLLDSVESINRMADDHVAVFSDVQWSMQRQEAGLLIRQCKGLWRAALVLSCAFEIVMSNTASLASPRVHPSSSASPSASVQPMPPSPQIGEDTEGVKKKEEEDEGLYPKDIFLTPPIIAIINKYISLENKWAIDFQLESVWDMKALLDGAELGVLLPAMEKGPMVGRMMDEQLRWQLRYPKGSRAELTAFLQQRFEEIR